MPDRRYALISPCRDEAEYARRTLDSVVAQSVRPARWVIVDDGSTDHTPAILAEYAAAHDWITVVRREDRGERKVGPGVIDAFYAGYETIDPEGFEYVAKIDLDLDLPPRYFERLMERMETDPRLATASGKPYFPPRALKGAAPGELPGHDELLDGDAFDVSALTSEGCGDETSVGMIKFYRTRSFEAVGGFVREVMWDGIDCHRCRMLGWRVASWDDPELRFVHLRPMGSSHKGVLTGRMRHGYGQWFMGTSLAYMTASAVFRLAHPPVVIGGLAMWWGYVRAMLTGKPRYTDTQFRRFLRRYQWRALLKGKSEATRQAEAAGARGADCIEPGAVSPARAA